MQLQADSTSEDKVANTQIQGVACGNHAFIHTKL